MNLPPFPVPVPGGDPGWVTLDYTETRRAKICSVFWVTGRLDLRPKAWLRFMRAELTKIETIARDAGCTEMRMAGRDWSRVFPDYEPIQVPGLSNVLRKHLWADRRHKPRRRLRRTRT